MMVSKTTTKSTDTIEELEQERQEIEKRLKEKKKLDAEVNLQDAVSKMDTSEENIAEIIKACYSYIGTHRKR